MSPPWVRFLWTKKMRHTFSFVSIFLFTASKVTSVRLRKQKPKKCLFFPLLASQASVHKWCKAELLSNLLADTLRTSESIIICGIWVVFLHKLLHFEPYNPLVCLQMRAAPPILQYSLRLIAFLLIREKQLKVQCLVLFGQYDSTNANYLSALNFWVWFIYKEVCELPYRRKTPNPDIHPACFRHFLSQIVLVDHGQIKILLVISLLLDIASIPNQLHAQTVWI